MGRYVEKKVRKEGNLPQILGLTASPGTGGNKQLDKAVEHVLQVCLNIHIRTGQYSLKKVLKGQFSQKCKYCHFLLTLMLFQTRKTFIHYGSFIWY